MKLEPGDQFTAEIDDFVVGKAIVKDGRDIINVGPLDCEPGTSVHLKYLGEETTSEENKIPYAVSLDDSLHGDGYDQYIQNRVRDMLPDRPPESGEITYAEIQTIGQRNLAQTVLGGETIELGPVNAREGDLVKIEGVSDGFAKVLTDSASGQNYEMRFNILAQISAKIPVDVGDEFTTIISHVEENQLAATVKGVPVVFQSGDAQKAQKVDGRITGFEKDQAVAEITERHDEVGRVSDTGIWARRQWLQDAINSEEPLRDLACEFLKCSPEALPETDSRVRDALIAEAIRLALHEKAEFNPDEYPRVHVMGLRHWVEHKLGAVLGWLDEGDDWFSSILTDRNGPTLTFLGDIMKLANGYYAPAPTRAVMAGDGDAVLISGAPTRYFQRDDLDLEVRGLSRVVTDTQPEELEAQGISVQSIESYLGDTSSVSFADGDLSAFRQTREATEWTPQAEWVAYEGEHRYGFNWGEDPLVAVTEDGAQLSCWRAPREYGAAEYHLKISPAESDETLMIPMPAKYWKPVCLSLDAMSGVPRRVEITDADEQSRVSLNFAPPQAQMRWLNAIGAEWEHPKLNQLHWQFDSSDVESVRSVFDRLPVEIADATQEVTTQ